MRSLIEKGEPVIFGGEGNGGLIFPDHQFCRDGGMTAAMMVSLLASSEKKLSELARQLPERHIIKDKIVSDNGAEILAFLSSQFHDRVIDRTDGVKIGTKDAWALVRASGTEPIIRIIIDARSQEEARSLYDDLKSRLKTIVV